MTRRVQENKVGDQILEILQRAFERELGKENVTPSRPERMRLFRQVTESLLTDVLGKIGAQNSRRQSLDKWLHLNKVG